MLPNFKYNFQNVKGVVHHRHVQLIIIFVPHATKLCDLHSLEVVDRVSETQLQVGEYSNTTT